MYKACINITKTNTFKNQLTSPKTAKMFRLEIKIDDIFFKESI